MIIRLIAVDPNPELGHSDILVYQVPENSREFKLLSRLLDEAHIEWCIIESSRHRTTTPKT